MVHHISELRRNCSTSNGSFFIVNHTYGGSNTLNLALENLSYTIQPVFEYEKYADLALLNEGLLTELQLVMCYNILFL